MIEPMARRVVLREELAAHPPPAAARTATCIVDLRLPCHLACAACWRPAPPSPGGLAAARSQLLAAATAAPEGRLRAVFFGGDVFVAPHAVAGLLADACSACEEHGRGLDALLLSDGVGWTDAAVGDLVRRGVRLAQVTLDGRAALHDRLHPLTGGGGSWEPIVASLAEHRGPLRVVVRMNADADDPEVEALADALEARGLFAGPNPVLLYVAPPAPYREQVRDLLELADGPARAFAAGASA